MGHKAKLKFLGLRTRYKEKEIAVPAPIIKAGRYKRPAGKIAAVNKKNPGQPVFFTRKNVVNPKIKPCPKINPRIKGTPITVNPKKYTIPIIIK
ncbi:MAG: hypothetical protein STSR0004_18000 [Peptococcaceae bacterium]